MDFRQARNGRSSFKEAVGYDKVDKAKAAGISVNPDSDKTDLGLIVVTYTAVVPDGGGSPGGDDGGTT